MPFIVVGNCCDASTRRVVSYDEGAALAEEYGVPFFECSAKDDINIESLFLRAISSSLDFAIMGRLEILVKDGNLEEFISTFQKIFPSMQQKVKFLI